MAASMSRPNLTSSLPGLQSKMASADSDLRLQALIDLTKDVQVLTSRRSASSSAHPANTRGVEEGFAEEYVETQVTNLVLTSLDDSNSEVKNAAVICIGAMARKSRSTTNSLVVKRISASLNSDKEETRDVACLALKSFVTEIPTDAPKLQDSLAKIIDTILAITTSPNSDTQLASELLQSLTDTFVRFPSYLPSLKESTAKSLSSLLSILNTARPSIRKRAIPAISALLAAAPNLFDASVRTQLQQGLQAGGETGKAYASAVASLSRGSVVRDIGTMLSEGETVEALIAQAEDTEDVEAVEGALIALETLLLRCQTEMTDFIDQVTKRSIELIKYDPNYVELDEEDDVDMNGDDEEDDDFDEEAYTDDEDDSWKIRRAAAKTLAAIVGSRYNLLLSFYLNLAPTLITRLNEREESVRLEVFAATEVLLRQTGLVRAAEVASKKRKWPGEQHMDDASVESPLSRLRSLLPSVLKVVLKQMSSRSVQTRQQCFVLLRLTVEALEGGLESEIGPICSATSTALRSIDHASSSALAIAALAFLSALFRHHSARVYAAYLGDLIPTVISCMKNRLQRINFEAFAAASSLAVSVRPAGSASPLAAGFATPIKQLFDASAQVLADTSVDGDVRERALETLGNLLVHAGDILGSSYQQCLPLIAARLNNEATANTALHVVGKIADSPACGGTVFDSWLLQILPDIITALRRNKRGGIAGGKTTEFSCLLSVLARIGDRLPADVAINIVSELQATLDSPTSVQIIANVLFRQPGCRSTVEQQILPRLVEDLKSQALPANMIEAFSQFFGAYVDGDVDCAIRLVPTLTESVSVPQTSPAVLGATARCIGTIAAHSKRNIAGIVSSFSKTLQSASGKDTEILLALLSIGEIGRVADLSGDTTLYDKVNSFFEHKNEELRAAAAFAAGNLAVGGSPKLLPLLIKQSEAAKTGEKRVLMLHALKEVILHSNQSQLELMADSLWPALISTETSTSLDEGVRNVKAACIGKLLTLAPTRYLPQLQSLFTSTPTNRAIVAASIRYAFIDTSTSYDELISSILSDFLRLLADEDLIVRRLALSSINAAIQNKPYLLTERLAEVQQFVYAETVVKPELQRSVQMGPWKVIEDDGLENRKNAYEAMYTMLGTCFTRLDLPVFTDRVMDALTQVNEIKVLGFMLLLRLAQTSPTTVVPRLDDIVNPLREVMKDVEVKDDTVKQDLERKEEMQRSALRTAVPLYKISTAQQAPNYHAFLGTLLNNEKWKEWKSYQA